MWDDFIQEETRRNAESDSEHGGGDEEENVALVAKGKKKKKGSHKWGQAVEGRIGVREGHKQSEMLFLS